MFMHNSLLYVDHLSSSLRDYVSCILVCKQYCQPTLINDLLAFFGLWDNCIGMLCLSELIIALLQ